MTLTELRYLVALDHERHFGRAAERCFVAQPTLSVAVKKLEDELGVTLFERSPQDVRPTEVGSRVIAQARIALAEAARVAEVAASGKDPLIGALRLGTLPTIGPWLLPRLVPRLKRMAPSMPLLLEEAFTDVLLGRLKSGELDVAILATPTAEPSLLVQPVYDEVFRVLLPADHPWSSNPSVDATRLADESLLTLGSGNCFRDQVVDLCALADRQGGVSSRVLEGSSLETIRHMVASGVGISVMPAASVDGITAADPLLRVKKFSGRQPKRTVALVWRNSFPRHAAVELVRLAILDSNLPGTSPLAPRPEGAL